MDKSKSQKVASISKEFALFNERSDLSFVGKVFSRRGPFAQVESKKFLISLGKFVDLQPLNISVTYNIMQMDNTLCFNLVPKCGSH